VYTYHPCIIRDHCCNKGKVLKELMKKDGKNSAKYAASYFTTSRTPGLIYMGCTPHQNSTQSEIPPQLSFLIPILTDPFILMKANAVFA
jgi:hypothetical protein